MRMNEFTLIDTYFAPLAGDALDNDGAVLAVPEGRELVVSSDVLNEGVHFLVGESGRNVAQKALRVNVSDLASMGARPLAYQLGLALPQGWMADEREAWVKDCAEGLAADQAEFGITLSGGDTTSIMGGVSVSITVFGTVETGGVIGRGGARDGDLMVLTGCVGDAFVGLQALLRQVEVEDARFVEAYLRPTPRVALVDAMRGYVRAAADVSDGLIADVGHIAKASGVRAVVTEMAFSDAAFDLVEAGAVGVSDLLSGGDDYELVMAVAPGDYDAFAAAAKDAGVDVQVIGRFEAGDGVRVLDADGAPIEIDQAGWQHF
jgi:thiamine-monophosphate kinase